MLHIASRARVPTLSYHIFLPVSSENFDLPCVEEVDDLIDRFELIERLTHCHKAHQYVADNKYYVDFPVFYMVFTIKIKT